MDQHVTEEKIQEIAKKIIDKFQPEKIILFGSYVWGMPEPDSDVDLFIIKETDNTRKTAREIDGSLWGRLIPLDIIVYTPESVERNLIQGDFFIRDIISKGKILYAKQ